ncbi:hypothetical protein B188_04170 [Candidatus Brocadiaceae bacterium B188]|nr:MAG: hypothetical protein EX330_03890 [Candidatus Brocadia sp. BROELEC01]TWU52463.1 hypothetical protein B188_04170 [Candidatus Brocadiaceae bacterium B188]
MFVVQRPADSVPMGYYLKKRYDNGLGFPLPVSKRGLGAFIFESEKLNSFYTQCYYLLWQIAFQVSIDMKNSEMSNCIKTSEERYEKLFNYAAFDSFEKALRLKRFHGTGNRASLFLMEFFFHG